MTGVQTCALPICLVTTLMWGKETLDLEEITSALLGFQMRKKASDEGTQGEGLVVKGNQERGRSNTRNGSRENKSRSKSRRRKDIQCYKCGKKGHMKRECSDRKKGMMIRRVPQSLRM